MGKVAGCRQTEKDPLAVRVYGQKPRESRPGAAGLKQE